jgi:hypothetical protein
LKRFYRLVHPDLFRGYEQAALTNQQSFAVVQQYLEEINTLYNLESGKPPEPGQDGLVGPASYPVTFLLMPADNINSNNINHSKDKNSKASSSPPSTSAASNSSSSQSQARPGDVAAQDLRQVKAMLRRPSAMEMDGSQRIQAMQQHLQALLVACGLSKR